MQLKRRPARDVPLHSCIQYPTQKWGMLHLPQIDQLGEATPGLTAIVTGPTRSVL